MCKLPFRDKSSRCGLAAILACFSCAFLSTALTAAEGSAVFYLSVSPRDGQSLDAGSVFSAGLENAPLKIISATPFGNRRPIVLVVDPGSYTRAEARQRIAALAKAFAARAAVQGVSLRIRMGIPVLDGVLSDLLADPKTLAQGLDKLVDSYFPGGADREQVNFSRTLDLIAALVRKAEQEAGPVDCLVVARDRRFLGDEASYLNASTERQFLDVSLGKGSTFHGWIGGTGMLRQICAATGGLTFSEQQAPESVARQVLDAQARGFLLEIEKPAAPATGSRSSLSIQARSGNGSKVEVRAPSAFWLHPGGSRVPDQYHTRQALDWIRRARESVEDENLTSALRFIDHGIEEDSLNPEAFYLGGRIAAGLGDLQLSASYLARALDLGNPDERTLVLFSQVSHKLGRSRAALETLQSSIKAGLAPTPALKLEMARLLSASGKDNEAATVYAELFAAGQDDVTARSEYGRALWRQGKASEAAGQLQTALAKDPKNIVALAVLSEMSLAQGKPQEAVEWGLRAVQANPKDPDGQAQMGKVEAGQGNWTSASGYYRTAFALAPARRDFLDLLVQSLTREGKLGEAEEMLRRVLESDSADTGAYRSLAQIQTRSGEIGEAVSTLEIGAAQGSRQAHELYREAAELRERRGEYGQALLDYRAMLQSSPPEIIHSEGTTLSHHLSFLARFLRNDKDTTQASSQVKSSGMIVPGGVSLLARTLGVDPALLKEADGVERMFAFIMEVAPSQSNRLQDNPIRRDLFLYLRHYDALVKHLRKSNLLPEHFEPAKGHELVFPLIGEGEDLKRTKQLLGFFGIGFKGGRGKDGNYEVALNLKQSRGASERQQLLRNLGVNVLDRNARAIRFTARDEEMPLLFDAETWSNKILAGEKAKTLPLLGRFVANVRAMRLYLALAGCSESTREGLVRYTAPGELMTLLDAVSVYGRYLEFKDGKLRLPGSNKAWEALVGAPPDDPAKFIPALLRHDEGRPMLLYYALSVAPAPVQKVLTASAERLLELYQFLPAASPPQAQNAGRRQDLGRLLRQMKADDQTLLLDVGGRFGKYLLASEAKGAAASQDSATVRVPIKALPRLLEQRAVSSTHSMASVAEVVEFIRYLHVWNPEVVEDGAADAIMRDLDQSPVFLDLIWDLRPPASLLAKYLAYCETLSSKGARGWNENQTRTSQALFHIISLLHREGTLSREQGLKLFATAMEQMAAEDEATFAFQVAGFVSDHLLPLLAAQVGPPAEKTDLLLQGLAGPAQIREFSFDGKQLQFDPAHYKLQRMSGAIQQQRYTPLSSILEVFKMLHEVRAGKELPRNFPEQLASALGRIQSAEFAPETPSSVKAMVAHVDVASLVEKARRPSKSKSSNSQEIFAALHTELGVTLLTYCYAYHGAAETDALAFDANFVRKHSFYDRSNTKGAGWTAARLEQKEGLGAYIVGSVSGLGFELSNLETAQSAQSFGRREGKSLVPTILSGLRAMHRTLLSDRAQEYVALSVRSGREALALSGIFTEVRSWCDSFLSNLVPPKRRERAMALAKDGNSSGAAEVLSPSELFLVGEAFVKSPPSLSSISSTPDLPGSGTGGLLSGPVAPPGGEAGGSGASPGTAPEELIALASKESDCPVSRRLKNMAPDGGTPEGWEFRRELEQYGVLLRKRLGLNQLSLSIADSYEQLEISAGEEVLFERICDLKIRMAELNHAVGLPAYLAEVLGELAIRDILPKTTAVRTNSWKMAIEQIGRLGTENARNWVDELLNRGILAISTRAAGDKGTGL